VSDSGTTPFPGSSGDSISSTPVQGSFDTSIAHPARVYDYWLGGKDNFAADRTAGDQVIEANPNVLPGVRANRAFLQRAVRYLAAEAGIRQFLDLGTGLPTAPNTHEVAQSIAPDSRIVYVDNDPIVLVHAKALLTSTPEGATSYIQADIRDPATILSEAAGLLDFTRPVAVTALMTLQYIPDSDNPHGVISEVMAALSPGSYLTISDLTRDIDTDRVSGATDRLNARMGPTSLTLRPRDAIAAYFAGFDFVDPGLVALTDWRPEEKLPEGVVVPALAGMARKPGV
jgi:hypothetical protein